MSDITIVAAKCHRTGAPGTYDVTSRRLEANPTKLHYYALFALLSSISILIGMECLSWLNTVKTCAALRSLRYC